MSLPHRISAFWFYWGFPIGLAAGMVIATGADLSGVKRDHEALHRANLTIQCQDQQLFHSAIFPMHPWAQVKAMQARAPEGEKACDELREIEAREAKLAKVDR